MRDAHQGRSRKMWKRGFLCLVYRLFFAWMTIQPG